MAPTQFLTPKNFLLCCGYEKKKCIEATFGAYLGEQFLHIPIYKVGSTFDSYCITQNENFTSRYFMNPTGKSRRSVSLDKCAYLYSGITDDVLQSVVETVENRMKNPAFEHPSFDFIYSAMKKKDLAIDQEAEADIVHARKMGDAVCIMILLMAAIFQDYYSGAGIYRKVRSYLSSKETDTIVNEPPAALLVREEISRPINPVSGLRTNQTYVRRGDLLKEAEKKLSRLEKMGEKRFLLLYGAPGNGKSELARAYASENAGIRFRKEVWLTCPHGEEQISLAGLCRDAEPDSGGRDLLAQLSMASKDILLVLDNCNTEINSLINELYYHTGEATVLITSRLSTLSGFDERNALRVFSENQLEFCLDVFRKNYEKKLITRRKRVKECEETAVEEICRRVYLNPLFISMIASFLREHGTRITIDDFNKKLESGLLEAFPMYSQLSFRKDEMESMSQPQEVLKIILRQELDCIRLFGEEERQIMNLMMLFPAEPLSRSLVGEILGDNKEQVLIDTVMDRLLSIALLQQEGEKIAVHPLVCELIHSGVLMEQGVPILYQEKERDAFYSHVLEHIFLFEQSKIRDCMHLAHTVYREIQNPDQIIQLIFRSFFDRRGCTRLLQDFLKKVEDPQIIACWETALGRKFILKNMLTGEIKNLLDLSERRYHSRYFNHENQQISGRRILTEADIPGEATLIFYYDGVPDQSEMILLDFSDGIGGHPITAIPDAMFRTSSRQFRIKLPGGLRVIGEWAFDNCRGFRGPLELPDSVEKIGRGAFHHCSNLDGELVLPKELKVLDDLAFCLCSSLSGQLQLPDKLEEIGELAFCFCRGLTGEVKCPPKLRKVKESAFFNCLELKPAAEFSQLALSESNRNKREGTPVYISPFQDRIENEAFYGRLDLTGELRLPASISEIGDQAFYRCGGITGELQFSSSLKKIGMAAFLGCTGLGGSIDFPDSCEVISDGAFFGCTGLQGSVRFSRNMKKIASAAFFMCTGLTGIRNLEEMSQLTTIGEGAFFQCESLTGELFFPVNLCQIDDGAFDRCSGLTALYFSKTAKMKRLGDGSFHKCSGLKGTLHIPVSMEYVGIGCFHGCGYDTCIVHNRFCILREGFINSEVLLVGYKESTAGEYAKKYGNPFQILE